MFRKLSAIYHRTLPTTKEFTSGAYLSPTVYCHDVVDIFSPLVQSNVIVEKSEGETVAFSFPRYPGVSPCQRHEPCQHRLGLSELAPRGLFTAMLITIRRSTHREPPSDLIIFWLDITALYLKAPYPFRGVEIAHLTSSGRYGGHPHPTLTTTNNPNHSSQASQLQHHTMKTS
jgi:hypothetical protein